MAYSISVESISSKILFIRGEKVLLDRDLAAMYGVTTKVLNQAVKRNIKRFPPDFMFSLSESEKKELVTNCDRFKRLRHSSALPHAFKEQGVAQPSSVLNSENAIEVNIAIMRAFVHVRELAVSYEVIERKLGEIEARLEDHDEKIKAVFEAIRQLISPIETGRRKIGFEVRERGTIYRENAKRDPK